MRNQMKYGAAALLAALLVACPPPPPPPVTINVQQLNSSAPGAVRVATNQGAQFKATSSTPVSFTWSIVVNGSAVALNTTHGNLNPTSGELVTYTAPSSVPAQPVLALRAANAANPSEYGEINLSIIAQGTAGISGNVTIPGGLLSVASLNDAAMNALGPMAALNFKQSARPFKPDWSLPHVPGQVLIVGNDGANLSRLSSAQSLRGLQLESLAEGVSRVAVPAGLAERDFAERVALETGAFVQPNYIYRPLGVVSPNDPQYASQFNLTQIDVAGAWAYQTDGVLVAVLDTGADFSHEDLAGRLVKGKDFCPNAANNCADPATDNPNDFTTADGSGGHGTHTTGIVAASTNNALGIAGITQAGNVLVVKVLGINNSSPPSFASGTSAALASGIRYAADQGAKIINMSLGIRQSQVAGFDPDALVSKAIDYADSKDVLMVAAAGNSSTVGVYFPASNPKVMAVGMVKPDNSASDFSERGPELDIVAPGQEQDGVATSGKGILSTKLGGGYERRNGTSEATPQVAAVASLIRAKNPSLTALQTRGILETTAKDLGSNGRDNTFGFGLLQAGAALRKAANPTTPPPAQTTVYVYADYQTSPGVFDGNNPLSGRTEVVMPGTSGSVSYTITVARNGTALQNGTYRVVACVNKNSNAIACDPGDLGPTSTPVVTYSGTPVTGQDVTLKQF